MNKTFLMVDLETLGLEPLGAIATIGAVAFDLDQVFAKQYLYVKVNVSDSVRCGMVMDAPTVQWWLQQVPAAQEEVYAGDTTLSSALHKLSTMWDEMGCVELWSHSSFDAAILGSAYRLCGVPTPWSYKQIRDIRTMTALWKRLGKKEHWPSRTGLHHQALDDAIHQAQYTQAMIKDLAGVML